MSNNSQGPFIINDFEGIMGGTLIDISDSWYYVSSDRENGKTTYTLTFQGINKTGEIFLRTLSNNTLNYQLGNFYKFDLANKNQYSMQLSGAFIDLEMNALERLEECE